MCLTCGEKSHVDNFRLLKGMSLSYRFTSSSYYENDILLVKAR